MSDSEDDIKPPPPKAGQDVFGDSSDDDAAPPPLPTDTLVDSDDELVRKPKKGKAIATKLDKLPTDDEEGGDASDDMFGPGSASASDADSASGGDDPSARRSIARRKSFGPDEEDSDSDEGDDSDDDDDDDDEDEAPRGKKAAKGGKGGKKRSRGADDDDEDDDDKKDGKKKRSKKKKANNASRFFADMADDMGEEDEDEEDIGERGVTEEELTAEEMAANALVEERHAKTREMLSTDASELAARYEAQHQQERKRKKIVQEMSAGLAGVGTGTVAQQALLPSVQDPSLWRVKCMTGKEFQLVRSVLLRHIHRQQQGARKNTLKSAFHSGAKGFIYIEAYSEVCAKEAVMGLRGLYATSFTKISIAEMTQVISTSVRKKPLREGQWVRLRRGPLRGDLARIVELLDGGSRAFVMAVPRPDYTSTAGSKSNIRHVQKIFDVVEAQQSSGIEAERRQHKDDRHGHYFDFWKNDYYKDGFLYKDVNVETYVQGADVKPRLEELQMFRVKTSEVDSEGEYDGEEEGKDAAKGSMQKQLMRELATQMKELEGEEAAQESQNVYRVADLVEVMSGELRGLTAKIVKIGLTTNVLEVVPVRNHNQQFSEQVLTVEMSMVTKYIEHGMHVKVIGGRYIGNTGRVVSVNMLDGDHIAAILTDGVNSEIQVNVSNCQISAEVSIGHGDLGGFELYDCVSLSENETAVVIHVGAEKLRVINHMNVVKDVYPQDISSKRNSQSSKQTAFDSSQTSVSPGDIVKVVSGQDYLGKSGTVKHIMRGNLWIHSNNHLKNAGVMAIRGRSCVLAGSNTSASSNSRAANMTGALGGGSVATIATTQPGGGGGRFGKDPAIGKTVKIIRGGFKGFLAQVADANPTHYTVELLARVKKIMIERTKCKEVGDKDGAFDKTFVGGVGQTRAGDVVGPLADVATPFLTAETPMHMMGSETPMHMAGSETPMQSSGDIPNDDLFKVNEGDRDRHTMATSIAAAEAQAPADFQVTPDVWDASFIVMITQGDDSVRNRHGVLKSRMDAEGCFQVSLIEHSGRLEPMEARHHYTALVLADIMIGAHVRVLHGDPRVVGFTGRSTWLSEDGRDVMLSDEGAGGTQLMKRAHCAVVYLES